MENKDWNEIERIVPPTTLEYLKSNLTRFQQKRRNTVPYNIRKIIDFIQSHQNIVICGMGIDAQKMMWQLDWNIDIGNYKNVIFYDKKIALRNQLYRGRNVIGIKELIHYKDYHFVICSKKFKIEIFYDLTQNGIDAEHILVFDEVN